MKLSHQELATLLSGTAEGEPLIVEGGVLWMPRPKVAPQAYRHRIYNGLGAVGLREVGLRYGARANQCALEWLSVANGARLFDGALILKGLVMSKKREPNSPLGQPISLDFGNLLGVPSFAKVDDLIAGTFIFEDDLLPILLSVSGEVTAFESNSEIERWSSIWDFISEVGDWIVIHSSRNSGANA